MLPQPEQPKIVAQVEQPKLVEQVEQPKGAQQQPERLKIEEIVEPSVDPGWQDEAAGAVVDLTNSPAREPPSPDFNYLMGV